jgi:cyclic pyranopterin phosphate synthase
MARLTHVDPQGDAHLVDVGDKPLTRREALAEGFVTLGAEAMTAVVERRARKGDVLAVAQLAGIQAAKRTSEIIPLCHPLPLDAIDVTLTAEPENHRIRCEARVRTTWRTGVEMEALTAVTGALLTIYDMLKAVDRTIEIGPVRLLSKSGGRTGDWTRSP